MKILVNPGTGPIEGASESEAVLNMIAWCQDHSWKDICFKRQKSLDKNGRYGFEVWRDSIPRGNDILHSTHEVRMPGLPLSKVRFLGGNQSIRKFPRLYVDGASWVWCYSLLDDDEDWAPCEKE